MKSSAEFLREIGAKKSFKEVKASKAVKEVIALARKEFKEAKEIPGTTYSRYRQYLHAGERRGYEDPYFLKRKQLALAVLAAYFTKEKVFIDKVNDYLISICEETNWVCPAHELHSGEIDLMAAETGLELAEAVCLLAEVLPPEVVARVKSEIEKRIFNPYLTKYKKLFWYKFRNNWSGVCNSAVGATFLHLETDKKRLKKALALVLDGLEFFISTAFEKDGGSTEGVSYWQYGLNNYVTFAELLRNRTKGKVDLLGAPRMKAIALYPLKMALSKGAFASFSDCQEKVYFPPSLIIKFAGRMNSPELYNLLNLRVFTYSLASDLRNIYWQKEAGKPGKHFPLAAADVFLESTQVVRLTVKTRSKKQLVLMAKAGHNEENHNHNDVGSFILHTEGESLLCDPGAGLYSKEYFTDVIRNKNIFCNSYGHNLPVIDGCLQKRGEQFKGTVTAFEPKEKMVEMEFAQAYGLAGVKSIKRTLRLEAGTNSAVLEDNFCFSRKMKIEEAFLTWFPAKCKGNTARIKGKKNTLELKIEEPEGATFFVNKLVKECKENAKNGVLSRLAFVAPEISKNTRVRVRMTILQARSF